MDTGNSLTLSPTKISTYLQCPRKYQHCYVDKVRVAKSPAMAVGSAVHSIVEKIHAAGWTLDDRDEAAGALAAEWDELSPTTSDPTDPDAGKAIREACDTWLPWYLQWRTGQLDIAVEEKWELEVPGTSLAMRGIVDRVYRANGETVISDVKTGKRAPTAQDLATDLQMSLYSWAYRQMSQANHEDAIEIVQIRQRTTLRTYRSDDYLDHVIHDVVTPTAQAIQAGLFPANPSTKFGCGFCDYQGVCPVGQGCGLRSVQS